MTQSAIIRKEKDVLAGSKKGISRIISAIFGIAALLTLLYLGRVAFFITVTFIFFACLLEFIGLMRNKKVSSPPGERFGEGDKRRVIYYVIGILYLALLFTLNATLNIQPGKIRVFFLLLGTWSFDTAAYYIGSKWGKHKITPKISPNKSLEGLLAGILAVTVIGILLPDFILPAEASYLKVVWIVLVVVGAFGGDLIESAFKRSLGAKDSSQVIPGHGGFLDRFDSLILASTLNYIFFRIIT